jgi:hypothetical protein
MEKQFREDYLDMNHTILELLLNLSGNYIENGSITQNSVLFKQKKKKNDLDQHWEFYMQKNKQSIFSSDNDSDEDNQVDAKTPPKQSEPELFIIGNKFFFKL